MCKENSESNSIKNKKWGGNCSKRSEENNEKKINENARNNKMIEKEN